MEYGLSLWEALFTGPVYDAFLAASAVAATATDQRLRVRLWIDQDAPSLHAVAWERLLNRHNSPPKPLSISANHPFSRYLGISRSISEPVQEVPLHLLCVVSNPPDLDGLPALDVNLEVENIFNAVGHQTNLKMTILAGKDTVSDSLKTRLHQYGHTIIDKNATLDNIIRTLAGNPFNILHILAHGRFVRIRDESELFLQDSDGFTMIVSDTEIILRLGAVPNLPHLIFLAACESASRRPGSKNGYVGLASKLVASGVSAVVAMQDMLPIDAAQKLTGDFYMFLMQNGVVDRALAQARLLLFDPDSVVWSIPVLYMRLKDGILFDIKEE
jgi:CHAT domain-containing protein